MPILEENTMTDYKFETDLFGLSDSKIHLLRNRFNYENIELSIVDKIVITNGRQVNNWFILLISGLFLMAFGLFTATKVIYEYFFANNFIHFYIEQFVIPVIPISLGSLCIYFSLKIGPVMTITYNNKTKRLPISELKKSNQLDKIIEFLQTNTMTRNKLKIEMKNKYQ